MFAGRGIAVLAVVAHTPHIRIIVFLLLLLCIINNIKTIIIYFDVFNDLLLYTRGNGHCRVCPKLVRSHFCVPLPRLPPSQPSPVHCCVVFGPFFFSAANIEHNAMADVWADAFIDGRIN